MTFLFYSAICVLLTVIQTSVLPAFKMIASYDLFIPLIVYMAAYRPMTEAIPVVLSMGILFDDVSSGILGIYTIPYIWIFIIIRWLTAYIKISSFLPLAFGMALASVFQNIYTVGTIVFLNQSILSVSETIRLFLRSFLGALITGPLIFFAVSKIHEIMEAWKTRISARENGNL